MQQLMRLFIFFILATTLLTACGGSRETTTPAEAQAEVAVQEEQPASSERAPSSHSEGMRTFIIIPEESRASYIVKEEFLAGALSRLGIEAGLYDTVGSTQAIEGQFELNLNDLSNPLGTNRFTVDLTTLTSDQSRRDRMIRERFLQLNRYPTAEFVATAAEGLPEKYEEGQEVTFQLKGDLTLRETTRPVTFDVTATLQGDTLQGVATTQILLTDFGFEPPSLGNVFNVANEVTLKLEFTAREQK